MTMVRALVLEAPGRLMSPRLALPDVGDDDGILRVEACGVRGRGPGDVVAAPGPGVRGQSHCAAAQEAGAALVMGTGIGRRDNERLALAKAFGADLVVDAASTEPVAALRDAAGRLADVVVA